VVNDEWKGTWVSQLSKETREKHKDGFTELKGKQLSEVFDEFFNNRSKLKNAVVFPGKDAAPEEFDEFLKRMDIPKTAEEYGIDGKIIPGDIPDEQRIEAANNLASFFKSIALTKGQAKKVYNQYLDMIKQINEAPQIRSKALAESFEERLTKELGNNKDVTETKEYFKRALVALGDKQFVKELNDTGLLYSTAFVRGLVDIWKSGNQEPPIPQVAVTKGEEIKDALPKSDQFNQRYGGRK
jgi:hypothetical protein